MTRLTLKGGDKIQQALQEIADKIKRGGVVRVGFLENATYPDGTPVAMVAAINNFGAPEKGIPARPFFTKMIEEKSPKWGEQLANLLKATDFDTGKALAMMGEGIAGQLRQAIIEMNEPANSPVTNLLKQRFPMAKESGMTFADVVQAWQDVAAGEDSAPAGKPLVWTGIMLGSVDYEVVDGS